MTSHIDRLLAKARLVSEPYTQDDINAAARRVAARVAARRADPQAQESGPAPSGPQDPAAHASAGAAAQDLRTLCETAVMSIGALASLRRFVARSLPEPPGARVLGCILQLTEQEDSARSWWQYAAGAGDSAATYCLYLHHLAHGEQHEANWWRIQAEAASLPGQAEAGRQEFATTLRILRGLKTGEETQDLITRTMLVSAVLDYVPAAVAYADDDLDLPLPDADFTDRITSLTTPATTHPERAQPHSPLPHQPVPCGAASSAAAAHPTSFTGQPSASPATTASVWQWNDSGGAFGHKQRIGSFAAAKRRENAWQAFWQHCEECADCDPAGIPCPAYQGALW
ncbi:hypothetical protein [Streptomyces sp. NPDC002845]